MSDLLSEWMRVWNEMKVPLHSDEFNSWRQKALEMEAELARLCKVDNAARQACETHIDSTKGDFGACMDVLIAALREEE